jgi:chemotaxis protein CheD
MELLINECMKQGAERRRLEAKVFGGGHVLQTRESDDNVPQSNIRFALTFLDTENIPIVARDLGGYEAREIYFFTDSGRILLKRMSRAGEMAARALASIEREEREKLRDFAKPAPVPDDSNVTLF